MSGYEVTIPCTKVHACTGTHMGVKLHVTCVCQFACFLH